VLGFKFYIHASCLHIPFTVFGDHFSGMTDEVAGGGFVAIQTLVMIFIAKKYQFNTIIIKMVSYYSKYIFF